MTRSRRELLLASGILMGLGGCQSPPSDPTPPDDVRGAGDRPATPRTATTTDDRSTPTAGRPRSVEFAFDRKLDAIEDLGMDPTGEEPIDPILRRSLQNNTLITFPPGEYLVTETHEIKGLTDWGFRGTGDNPRDVRFVPPKGETKRFLKVYPPNSDRVLLENFAFDQRTDWTSGIGNIFFVRSLAILRDIDYLGWAGNEKDAKAISRLHAHVLDPDGLFLIEGMDKRGREWLIGQAAYDNHKEGALMIWCGHAHQGTLLVRDSHFENCGSHGMYASRQQGAVKVENCTFKNNQNTQVRIAGPHSWVKDTDFIWDVDKHPNKDTYPAMTGLVWESGTYGRSGGVVEDCNFVCRSSTANSGCLKVDGSYGAVTARNCRFRVEEDYVVPVSVGAPGDSPMIRGGKPDKPWAVTLRDLTINGLGEPNPRKPGALGIHGRAGSTLRDLCINISGNRDGIHLSNGRYTLMNIDISVGGEPILLNAANMIASHIDIDSGSPC